MKTWIGTLGVVLSVFVALCGEVIADELLVHVVSDGGRVALLGLNGNWAKKGYPSMDAKYEGQIDVKVDSGNVQGTQVLCFQPSLNGIGSNPDEVCVNKGARVYPIVGAGAVWQLDFKVESGNVTGLSMSNLIDPTADTFNALLVNNRVQVGTFTIMRLSQSPGCYYTDSMRIC